ncbi:MAG: sugar MFS transporter [Pedobacter sp.]|uniref:sugar MFS transporter n=1 Tax=Pedobacter sp. TaxID=1411316 RepID=UPI003399B612
MTTTVKKGIQPIFIIGALFFVFGFVTWLNSVLIPYLRLACELNNFESYLVAFAFYISYLVMAIPSASVLNKTGFKNGMALGLVVMGVGALIFIPAALTRTYALFLLGLFVQGTGLALLQTASNPYITILGPADSAAKRISVMGICNKVAGAIAPIILGAIALKDADGFHARLAQMSPAAKIAELNLLASRVILPYAVIIVVLVILAVLIYFSTLPEVDADKEDEEVSIATAGKTSVFQFPHLLLGVLTMFLYVGVEVMAGDTVISYGAYQGVPLATAKFFTSFTLLGMILGYLVGIVCIPKYLSQENAMKWFAALGVVLTLVAIFTTSYVSVLFIALLGFANSMVYPAIWPLALNGVGRFTKMASSLLIMGIAGGAVIPLCYGALADIVNPQQAYWIMVPCYIYIFYYATTGCKVGKSVPALKSQPVI